MAYNIVSEEDLRSAAQKVQMYVDTLPTNRRCTMGKLMGLVGLFLVVVLLPGCVNLHTIRLRNPNTDQVRCGTGGIALQQRSRSASGPKS